MLTAIRLGTPVAQCGHALFPNGERHLRPRLRLAHLYPRELLAETLRIAARCSFSLDELRYEYPEEIVPAGADAGQLSARADRSRVSRGAFPGRAGEGPGADRARTALIAELGYEPYFLTVHDIVASRASRSILCQGRGSAANSAVCYCLGITEVDPARMTMLFERFISSERNEPPDIDVDFEHERREEVIQYIYAKYGRERAALAATVICYRPQSALRDCGKALGLDLAQVDRLAKSLAWWDRRQNLPERLREAGLRSGQPDRSPPGSRWRSADRLSAPPVAARRRLRHRARPAVAPGADRERRHARAHRHPVGQGRSRRAGLLKVDVLALGMLTAIRRALGLDRRSSGVRSSTCSDVPARRPGGLRHDPAGRHRRRVPDRIARADGHAAAPEARNFYDLVIEVAIVRPGPIQGGMVHPYLRRRQGLEPVSYPSDAVKAVLERTLGVPIFQEQVMQLAMVAAGFTPGEADQLAPRDGGVEAQGRPRAFRDSA